MLNRVENAGRGHLLVTASLVVALVGVFYLMTA